MKYIIQILMTIGIWIFNSIYSIFGGDWYGGTLFMFFALANIYLEVKSIFKWEWDYWIYKHNKRS